MAKYNPLGSFLEFINGSTSLSAATFNSMQKSIQIALNDKLDCSDTRISDANECKACYCGIYPIQENAINFPFDTSEIVFDQLDGLLITLVPNGRSFGIQIAYDPINQQFWLRQGQIVFVSYSASTGTIYEFEESIPWKILGGATNAT